MKITSTLLLMLLCSTGIYAQSGVTYYTSPYPRFILSGKDTVPNAFTGGLVNPIISSLDLNGDGLKDLVAFDKSDNRVLTFRAKAKNSLDYSYTPQYQRMLPPGAKWYFFADFNGDKLPDLFTHTDPETAADNTGVMVYKNISQPKSDIKFELYTGGLLINDYEGWKPMANNPIDHPTFVDVDGDGDLDAVQFDDRNGGKSMGYYKNLAKEKLGRTDTLMLYLTDLCWGRVTDADTKYLMNFTCQALSFQYSKGKRNAHSGSTLLMVDLDADGDLEAIVGDGGVSTLTMMTNNRINLFGTWPTDSVTTLSGYPVSTPVDMRNMVQAMAPDVDNDGDPDLLLTPMEAGSKAKDFIWHYENQATGGKPIFQIKSKNFLESTMLDLGVEAAPALFDINKDGLVDLVTASQVDVGNQLYVRLKLFMQHKSKTGTPYFKLAIDSFLGKSMGDVSNGKPAFGDLDGDGKADLLMGDSYGNIGWWKNTTNSDSAQFGTFALVKCKPYKGNTEIVVPGNAYPVTYDVDNDGLQDLLIGTGAHNRLVHYRNTGLSGGAPLFEFVTDTFAGIRLMRKSGQQARFVAPAIADMDGDGKQDLVLGEGSGELNIYYDFNKGGTLTPTSVLVYNFQDKKGEDSVLASRVVPALGLIDQDNKPDILLGGSRGGFFYLGSVNNGQSTGITPAPRQPRQARLSFLAYPNPGTGLFRIKYDGLEQNVPAQLCLYDLLGRQVYTRSLNLKPGPGSETLEAEYLPEGVYMLNLQYAEGEQAITQRLIIKK